MVLKIKFLCLLFTGLLFTFSKLDAQSLGRVTFSSGGSSLSNQLPASMGEVFVGGKGNLFTMGSQQNPDGIVSTEHRELDTSVKLFPNPTSGLLSVSLSESTFHKGKFTVFSMLGQNLYRQDFQGNSFEFNAADLQPGIYYLKLYSPDNLTLKTIPFVKQ